MNRSYEIPFFLMGGLVTLLLVWWNLPHHTCPTQAPVECSKPHASDELMSEVKAEIYSLQDKVKLLLLENTLLYDEVYGE